MKSYKEKKQQLKWALLNTGLTGQRLLDYLGQYTHDKRPFNSPNVKQVVFSHVAQDADDLSYSVVANTDTGVTELLIKQEENK